MKKGEDGGGVIWLCAFEKQSQAKMFKNQEQKWLNFLYWWIYFQNNYVKSLIILLSIFTQQ